jgi:hypothetical protein
MKTLKIEELATLKEPQLATLNGFYICLHSVMLVSVV